MILFALLLLASVSFFRFAGRRQRDWENNIIFEVEQCAHSHKQTHSHLFDVINYGIWPKSSFNSECNWTNNRVQFTCDATFAQFQRKIECTAHAQLSLRSHFGMEFQLLFCLFLLKSTYWFVCIALTMQREMKISGARNNVRGNGQCLYSFWFYAIVLNKADNTFRFRTIVHEIVHCFGLEKKSEIPA